MGVGRLLFAPTAETANRKHSDGRLSDGIPPSPRWGNEITLLVHSYGVCITIFLEEREKVAILTGINF